MKNDFDGDMREKNIAFRFDGVVHSFASGWKGIADIPDLPVDGIRELFKKLSLSGFSIVIYSERAAVLAGRRAIISWLTKNKMVEFVSEVTSSVPIARCYIDDRAICFDGQCDVQAMFWKIINFKSGEVRND